MIKWSNIFINLILNPWFWLVSQINPHRETIVFHQICYALDVIKYITVDFWMHQLVRPSAKCYIRSPKFYKCRWNIISVFKKYLKSYRLGRPISSPRKDRVTKDFCLTWKCHRAFWRDLNPRPLVQKAVALTTTRLPSQLVHFLWIGGASYKDTDPCLW